MFKRHLNLPGNTQRLAVLLVFTIGLSNMRFYYNDLNVNTIYNKQFMIFTIFYYWGIPIWDDLKRTPAMVG